jgi:hypothetical protein
VFRGQALEQLASPARCLDEDAPPVPGVPPPPDESRFHAAVHQADGALVAHLEPFGQVFDGGSPRREAADEEEELVLGRRDPVRPGDRLGGRQEAAQGVK